jgi:hypothetical protein
MSLGFQKLLTYIQSNKKMTLKTQYENYLKNNSSSTLTYDEWENGLFQKLNSLLEDGFEPHISDGLEPHISDDFQIGPNGAYEHSDREIDIRKTMSYICVKLLEVTYNNGDISDIGNEVGVAVGEALKNLSESEVNQFIYGFRHGVSLTNGTHDTIPVTRSTNHGQGDGCF